METKIILCDSCKERVAKNKCDFCNKDLCSSCGARTGIKIANIADIEEIVCCKDCGTKWSNKIRDHKTYRDETFAEKIKKEVIAHIKKKAIADKIDDGN